MNKTSDNLLKTKQLISSARKSAPQRIKQSNLGKTTVNVINVDFINKKVIND